MEDVIMKDPLPCFLKTLLKKTESVPVYHDVAGRTERDVLSSFSGTVELFTLFQPLISYAAP